MLSSHVFLIHMLLTVSILSETAALFFFSAQSEYEIDQRLLEHYKMIV